jgi:hypothetical protein
VPCRCDALRIEDVAPPKVKPVKFASEGMHISQETTARQATRHEEPNRTERRPTRTPDDDTRHVVSSLRPTTRLYSVIIQLLLFIYAI